MNCQNTKNRYTFFVSLLMAAVLVWIAGMLAFKLVAKKYILSYAEESPIALPHSTLTEKELSSLHQRWEFFVQQTKHKIPFQMDLTETELNALIATHASWKTLKDTVSITFGDDVIYTSFCMDLQQMGVTTSPKRYLNGIATFAIWGKDGLLVVALEDIKIGNKHLPSFLLRYMKRRAVSQWFYDNMREKSLYQDSFLHIKMLQVTPEKMTIKVNGFPPWM